MTFEQCNLGFFERNDSQEVVNNDFFYETTLSKTESALGCSQPRVI